MKHKIAIEVAEEIRDIMRTAIDKEFDKEDRRFVNKLVSEFIELQQLYDNYGAAALLMAAAECLYDLAVIFKEEENVTEIQEANNQISNA